MLAAILLAPVWDATISAERRRALDTISAPELRRVVSFLADDKLGGRGTPSKGLDDAADFIAAEFKKAGLEPKGDDGFFQVTDYQGRNGVSGKVRNVVGVLKGSDPSKADEVVMVTAHYDHLGTRGTGEGDHIYNGANDDASGTAGVVALAHALGKAKPKRSVLFVTFWGEERGLLGSTYYGAHPVVPLAKTVADINLEQIGRTDDDEGPRVNAVSITGYDFSETVSALDAAGKVLGTEVQRHPQYSDPFFMRSDNAAMAAAGVPAHTICVAFEYKDYHGLADTADKLDYDNMTKVVRLAGLGILTLADAPQTPKWNKDNPKTERYRKVRGEGVGVGRIKTTGSWRERLGVPLYFAGLGAAVALFGLAKGSPSHDMAVLFVTVAAPFPVFFGAMYLSTFVHEMGHVVAAWAYGLKVTQVRVYNVRWVREGEGDAKSTGGGGVASEKTLAMDRPWPATILSLAGPAADLALLTTVALIGRRIPLPASAPLWSLAFWSARGAYISLVPSASGHRDSDIKHVLDHWKPESQRFAYHSLYRIWPVLEGVDPALVDPEDLRRALWIEEPRWRMAAAQIATYHAIATGSTAGVAMGRTFVERCQALVASSKTDEERASYESLLQDAILETAFCAALANDLSGARAAEAELDRIDAINWHTARRLDIVLARLGDEPVDARLAVAWETLERDRAAKPNAMWATSKRFLRIAEGDSQPRMTLREMRGE